MQDSRGMLLLLLACATKPADDSAGSTTPPSTADTCPTAGFLDVSTYDQPDPIPDPTLTVGCEGDFLVAVSNGIPNFEFVQVTPNALVSIDTTYRVPLVPEEDPSPATLGLGAVGVAVNGLPIYAANEAAPTYGDPYLDGILDYCNGHTDEAGQYHFHARPECLFPELDGSVSLLVGYAFDGYPILAPFECLDADCAEVTELGSSYVYVGGSEAAWEANVYQEGAGDLDACNGALRPDGTYAYYATDTFPYLIGCFHGVVPDGAGASSDADPPDTDTTLPPGPTECDDEADCEAPDACPPGSAGCTCAASPEGTQVCTPTCTTDDDCPEVPEGALDCDEALGLCVPA